MGLDENGLCAGSSGAKTYVFDGKKYPEFVLMRRFNGMLAQMSTSKEVKDDNPELLAVHHAPQLEASDGQKHEKGVWWSIVADEVKFDGVLDLVAAMHRPTRKNIRSAL